MEKTNPNFDPFYPEWKKVLWGMLRAFVGSFVPVFGFMLTTVTPETMKDRELLVQFLASLAISSMVSGIIGIGKFLRNVYPDSEIVSKLPF